MEISLKLFDPIKTKNDIYFSKIINNGDEFTFQISKSSLLLNKEKKKAKLQLNDSEIETINSIADEVKRLTSENSEKWFGKTIGLEDCSAIYKDAIVDCVLHCFFDENTIFFSSNEQFDINDIESDLKGIALLNCVGVVYTKTSFFLRFEINQFKIKSEKKVVNDYLIKDLDEHALSTEEESIIKKIEDITLF